MRVSVKQCGPQLHDKITSVFKTKILNIMLTIEDEQSSARSEFVLSGKEALKLSQDIVKLLEDEHTKKAGFTYAEMTDLTYDDMFGILRE